MEGQSHERLFELAKIAKKAGRYKDVIELMKELTKQSSTDRLTVEEYNLLAVAYKSLLEQKRISCRTMKSLAVLQSHETAAVKVTNYQRKIENEMKEIIEEVLSLLESNKPEDTTEAKHEVNYYKMKGDYNRYKAELTENVTEKQEVIKTANEAYEKGTLIASERLEPTDRHRLGLALNYSVFFSEIMSDTDAACHTAKQAFNDADSSIHDYSRYNEGDSTILIMQRLMENVTLWSSTDYGRKDFDETLYEEEEYSN